MTDDDTPTRYLATDGGTTMAWGKHDIGGPWALGPLGDAATWDDREEAERMAPPGSIIRTYVMDGWSVVLLAE